jgi:superfamily II DNA/RNA helicase
VYGGAKAKPQLLALAGGVEVLVATPGRLVEFLSSGLVGLDRCSHLVLDEADRMLGKENKGGGGGGLGLFQFSF